MALHWDVKEVADWKQLQEEESGITACVVWATMFVGIPRITADNAAEFARRVHVWEDVNGRIRSDDKRITLADVERRIGLWTNASRETRRQFEAKVLRSLNERATRALEA